MLITKVKSHRVNINIKYGIGGMVINWELCKQLGSADVNHSYKVF